MHHNLNSSSVIQQFHHVVQVDELEKWLDKEVQRQGKVKAHQAPVLHASAITAKVAELRQAFDKLNRKKKPAPPAVPKANATANGTEGANITAGE